jgi:hypothetical protein
MNVRRVAMREKVSVGLMLLVLVYLIVQLSGCTLIGMGVGSVLDNSSGVNFKTVSKADLATLKPGKMVFVAYKSGPVISGTFFKFGSWSRDEYAGLYVALETRGTSGMRFPRLGEKISTVFANGKRTEGEFGGFDIGESILLRRPGSPLLLKTSLTGLLELKDEQGMPLNLTFLRTQAASGQVPFLTTVWVFTNTGKLNIPSEQILEARVETEKNGKSIGLVIGLLLDAAAIISAASIGGLGIGGHF